MKADGYVQLAVRGLLTVVAGPNVAIRIEGDEPKVSGGVQTRVVLETGIEAWCARYGVDVVTFADVAIAGLGRSTDPAAKNYLDPATKVAVVFKAVNADFTSPRGGNYRPDLTPMALDWDGGKVECGGGLHFSPSVSHALDFHAEAKRFMKCYVALSEIRTPQPGDSYPHKIKAKGCVRPCVEVDRRGREIAIKAVV